MTPRRPRVPVTFLFARDEALPGVESRSPRPAVDVVDDGAAWRLVFEVPGATPDKLTVDVRGRTVTLRGERAPTPQEGGRFVRVERAAGAFERTLELPDDPDPERARASYTDGLLVLVIPRKTATRSRSIPVRRDT
jgi:HSP20 family protein